MPARRLHHALTTALVVLAVSLTTLAPAHAAAPAPGGLTGSSTDATTAVLSWDRVDTASRYDVQVAAVSDFSSLLWSASTVNLHAVPTVNLPVGEVYWRVRAIDPSGTSGWSSASFSRGTLPGPTLVSGAADSFDQPTQPPVLSWSPVAGGQGYQIQISPSSDFTDPSLYIADTTVKATTYVVGKTLVATTYYWRVRASLGSGVWTTWSDTGQYDVSPLPAAELTSPALDATVDDAVLDWQPVLGAASYDVQISSDENFNTIVASQTGITGTSWARPKTINNDQYWWRVRAKDTSGNVQDWSNAQVWRLQRAWPDQPVLEYPANGATVGDPFVYQWKPATLASSYTLQIATDPSFNAVVGTCTTRLTTLTPATVGGTACMPSALGTYYWRVQAIDGFASPAPQSDLINAQVFSFTYNPGVVTPTAPANGTTVSVPTLTWAPRAGASTYDVSVYSVSNGTRIAQVRTAATSWTVTSLLEPGQSYRWDVRTVTEDGRLGVGRLAGSQPTFTAGTYPTATATTPTALAPLGQTSARFPSLTWEPVQGAARYKVYVRRANTILWQALAGNAFYAAATDSSSTYLTPDSYQWMVEAYNEQGALLSDSSGAPGSFTIASPQEATGLAVGLRPTAINEGDSCTDAACANVRETPVLSWDASSNVGYYKLTISRDAQLTNKVLETNVYGTIWTPRDTLADSTAGQAYYWAVRPCSAGSGCAAPAYATHSFNKLSNRAAGLSPGVAVDDQTGLPESTPPVLADDVTLTWQDYLQTNTTAPQGSSELAARARTEARTYKVQISTTSTFQSLLDSAEVDQRSYTTYTTTYPEGPVYWRVAAVDGSELQQTWSRTMTFTKKSPAPTLAADPTDPVSGSRPLTWAPLGYAATYDLEVYKDPTVDPGTGAVIVQTANRVTNVTGLRQVAYLGATSFPADDYAWRVRRRDVAGRVGDWSSYGRFSVASAPPALLAPGSGAIVAPRDSVFTWEGVTGAATYRFERRAVGASTTTETATTPALAWAPKDALGGGDWEWRVVALDADGKAMTDLSATPWRGFHVDASPVATSAPNITGSGQVGTQLTGQDPTWNLAGVTDTYQWYRGTRAISGATASTYLVTVSDLNQDLSLRVTGSLPGYQAGTTTSNTIRGVAGPALTVATPPSLSGSAKIDQTLSVVDPVWDESGVRNAYQWLRNGSPIAGATRSSYRVTASDVGAELTARVTGSKTGFADGVVTTAAKRVPAVPSTTTAALAASTVAKGKRARITVTVTATGFADPTGVITVKEGSRTLKKFTLKGSHHGVKTLKLPALAAGKHKLKAFYAGNAKITGSTSARVVLKVTR